jgi:hypothetical protein
LRTTPPRSTSRNDLSARGAGGGLNAGALKAAARLVATDVGDDDALGARLPALAHYLGDHVGIGVGGLVRGAVPGDVGLDDNHILAADEAPDAAQVFKRPLNQGARFAGLSGWAPCSRRGGFVGGVLNHGEMRELGIGSPLRRTMVAARLLGLLRDRTETVLAEPDARGRRARGRAAHAQQLQQSLAAREARRVRLLFFGLVIVFRGHRNPPGQISNRCIRCGSLVPNR